MKKTLLLACLLLCSLPLLAQNKVTTFLGIPVDGTKAEMIQKLKAKGFVETVHPETLMGEFNGRDVLIFVHTNRNIVWRIAVVDANTCDEAQIKVRFNNLCDQFEKNKKYSGSTSQTLSDDEDISYEMTVHDKEYQAAFFQMYTSAADTDSAGWEDRMVWFTIAKGVLDYKIMMFYDNLCNQADGSDL